jgi:RNA polymerase sigma-70 factor (ECF subfamily)
MSDDQSTFIQRCLERLQGGDGGAREDLIRCACTRLETLTRTMLRGYGRLKRWEETGDVLQSALLRLTRCLAQVVPATTRDFYRLAAVQIRRELIDLARHYYRPDGPGARHSTAWRPQADDSAPPAHEPADESDEPSQLALWSEFQCQAEALPEEERELLDLLWYQGLSQPEAARLLGLPERTLKRRWQAVRLHLYQALNGHLPD